MAATAESTEPWAVSRMKARSREVCTARSSSPHPSRRGDQLGQAGALMLFILDDQYLVFLCHWQRDPLKSTITQDSVIPHTLACLFDAEKLTPGVPFSSKLCSEAFK